MNLRASSSFLKPLGSLSNPAASAKHLQVSPKSRHFTRNYFRFGKFSKFSNPVPKFCALVNRSYVNSNFFSSAGMYNILYSYFNYMDFFGFFLLLYFRYLLMIINKSTRRNVSASASASASSSSITSAYKLNLQYFCPR